MRQSYPGVPAACHIARELLHTQRTHILPPDTQVDPTLSFPARHSYLKSPLIAALAGPSDPYEGFAPL